MLSHYRLVEKIGEGGMGEVYRAEDTKLERQVAVKVLPDKLATDPERLQRFQREAKAIAALKHPNIVTIYSVEEVDGVHFLTMELVEGQTVADALPPDGFALDRFFEVAIALADALQEAHSKGILHRDLKPMNIMFDASARPKVLDFGLAKLLEGPVSEDESTVLLSDSKTQEGVVLGTVSYMSPEQAEGECVDPRSDIFALGILLYEMAIGERPFRGETKMSTLSSIINLLSARRDRCLDEFRAPEARGLVL